MTQEPGDMAMMGPAPGEESCGCGPTATWGLADAADPRYLGGHVDKQGYRHDPLRHADDCPRLASRDMIGLAEVRSDVWSVLDQAPAEVPALRAALVAGEVNGRVYTGRCACLIGTLARARGLWHPEEEFDCVPERPAEDFFWPIRPGDKPGENDEGQVRAAMAVRWIDEWTRASAVVDVVEADGVSE